MPTTEERRTPAPWRLPNRPPRGTCALIFLFAVLASSVETCLAEEASDTRSVPNILLLLADDLGYADLSCYGARNIKTPNLDRLARQGVRFTDFYAAAPNCSPSRTGLLTGRTPSRTGMYNYIPDGGPLYLLPGEITVARLLRDAGYATMHVGKWHLSYDLQSDTLPTPGDHGFDYWMSTENNASPSHRNPTNFVRMGESVGPLEGYSCQRVVDEAIGWLEETWDGESPFFTCVWFHEPHAPIASPPELIARHADAPPKDAAYYANVENLDLAVGRMLDAVDAMGLRETTFVMFSSDNGGVRPESNRPLRERKSFVFEGGIREPGIMRWPGRITPGTVCSEPAGLIDLLPTFCQMAGCQVPDDRVLDGVSLLPLFQGAPLERSTPLFWFFYRTTPAAAMRIGNWSLVGYLGGELPKSHPLSAEQMAYLKEAKLERFELFHLGEDIGQTTDLSDRYPERFEEMKRQLIEKHEAVVREGPVWTFLD